MSLRRTRTLWVGDRFFEEVPGARFVSKSRTTAFGLSFENPIGVAAGLDKNAEAVDAFSALGFGFTEVGAVTPQAQEGNPKPRVFRLPEDEAVINRFGFNNDGHAAVYQRLSQFLPDGSKGDDASSQDKVSVAGPDDRNMINENFWVPEREMMPYLEKTVERRHIVGVNLGRNKHSPGNGDYIAGVRCFGCLADFFVINVSSPNTAGLREMQHKQQLQLLIDEVLSERSKLRCSRKAKILVKLAPDLSVHDRSDIAEILMRPQCDRIDGLVISNTTTSRPTSLKSEHKYEHGGLSGPPLKDLSTQLIADMYRLTEGRYPIIGVGGISCGSDAYEKIKAGASLVQIYTSLVYHGVGVARSIQNQLVELLRKDGFHRVSEAVGSFHHRRDIEEESGTKN